MRYVFFMGKGGVGKTTTAAAFAVATASRGARTLVVSLDPAHNLGDVLGTKLGEKPLRVVENLWACEVDFEAMVARHLRGLADKVKDLYGYLRVLNLDKYIDVLRHSPGVEEYAVLEKVREVVFEVERKRNYDLVVFDTPPTGLTLRFMLLPFINKVWLEKLMELRRAILDRRRAILRVLGERPAVEIGGQRLELAVEESEDPVYRELKTMFSENERLISILRNSGLTSVVMVVNPEVLPILEASRARSALESFGVRVSHLVVNKVIRISRPPEELRAKLDEQEAALSMLCEHFQGVKRVEVPLLPREPRGLDGLKEYAAYIDELVRDFVCRQPWNS